MISMREDTLDILTTIATQACEDMISSVRSTIEAFGTSSESTVLLHHYNTAFECLCSAVRLLAVGEANAAVTHLDNATNAIRIAQGDKK